MVSKQLKIQIQIQLQMQIQTQIQIKVRIQIHMITNWLTDACMKQVWGRRLWLADNCFSKLVGWILGIVMHFAFLDIVMDVFLYIYVQLLAGSALLCFVVVLSFSLCAIMIGRFF